MCKYLSYFCLYYKWVRCEWGSGRWVDFDREKMEKNVLSCDGILSETAV